MKKRQAESNTAVLAQAKRSLIQRIPDAEGRKDDKTVAQEYPTHMLL